jgi:hypothetical protein
VGRRESTVALRPQGGPQLYSKRVAREAFANVNGQGVGMQDVMSLLNQDIKVIAQKGLHQFGIVRRRLRKARALKKVKPSKTPASKK